MKQDIVQRLAYLKSCLAKPAQTHFTLEKLQTGIVVLKILSSVDDKRKVTLQWSEE